MRGTEDAIRDWAQIGVWIVGWGYNDFQHCLSYAETDEDRQFWQTQLDVLDDLQTAISDRIKPKNETKRTNEKAY